MYEQLLHVGLTKTEASIYAMLLDLGKAQAGILSRKTGIHRRSIYDALDRLIEKGLASYIVENAKRFYMPTDPKRIHDLITHQQQEITTILPTLLAKYNEQKDKQETLFYRGKEALKNIFEDQITDGHDVYIIGASHNAKELLKYYIPHYTNERVKKKIKLHAIYAGEKHSYPIPLANVRYLPKDFASLVSTNIYGNKAVIILWIHDPVAILIKQPDIAKTFKHYFDVLWRIGKE